jgi:hypothetical protein
LGRRPFGIVPLEGRRRFEKENDPINNFVLMGPSKEPKSAKSGNGGYNKAITRRCTDGYLFFLLAPDFDILCGRLSRAY